MTKQFLILSAAAFLAASVGCISRFQTEAYIWQVDTAAQAGGAWQLAHVSTYQRRNRTNPEDRPVLVDADQVQDGVDQHNFEWRNVPLGEVVASTGYRVRPRGDPDDAAMRLERVKVNSRFGPIEEDVLYHLVKSIADMYGVDIVPGWSWKLDKLDAWGTGERIKSWGNHSWDK